MNPQLIFIIVALNLVSKLISAEPEMLESWFSEAMQVEAEAMPEKKVPLDAIASTREQVFQAYKAAAIENGWQEAFIAPNVIPANPKDGRIKISSAKYAIGEGLVMPYIPLQRGEKPEGGWPLVIAMHGGGGTKNELAHPHAWPVNTREWQTQTRLALSQYPTNAIYFVPRMVDDNQGRWWKFFNVEAFDAMIRHAILFWEVNPNRIYMLGISEGGYGTEALASRIPDKFAAANGLACGSGTSIRVENLRNLPFRTDVGEKDMMFGRKPNAVKKHALLDAFQEADPEGYIHHLEIHEGRGHGIEYRSGPRWMMNHTRKPHPERVTLTLFTRDGVKNGGAYWLQVLNDLENKVIFLNGSIDKENNRIAITAQSSADDEKVQSPDWQQSLADAGETTPASGLILRIWLHEKMLHLDETVEVSINGQVIDTFELEPQLGVMCESLMLYGDPEYIYPCKIEVQVP